MYVGNKAIRNLPIKCENVDTGCDWVGTVDKLWIHLDICDFALLSCPNDCEDDSNIFRRFLRKDLGKHVEEDCPNRHYKCEDCGREETYTYITKSHHEDCPVVVLPCPKRPCTEMLQRQYLERHIETECKHAVVCCKYKGIGCEREMKRDDIAAHEEDDKLHLHMAIDTTAKLSDCIATLKDDRANLFSRISALEDDRANLLDMICNPFTFVMEYVLVSLSNFESFESPHFYTSPKGYHMHMNVCCDGYGDFDVEDTHVSIGIANDPGEYDDNLSWPLKADFTVTLLNQLKDKNHFRKTIPVIADHEDEIEDETFIHHSALDYDPVKNTQYLKNDCLYFRVTVKLTNNWLECSDDVC